MPQFYLTKKAVKDLEEIWDYTVETWSETQAEKYYNLIISSCKELATKPKMGRDYDIISKAIKGYKIGEHIIFYHLVSKNEIEVIRILHGMMDLKSRI